jgi:hypothetical protein
MARRRLPVAIAALLAIAGALTVLFLPDDRRARARWPFRSGAAHRGENPVATISATPAAASRRPASASRTADRGAGPTAVAATTIATAVPSIGPVGTTTAGRH